MMWLSSESALAWCVAVFCVSIVARAFLHAAHRAAQPFGVEYGFARERGTVWFLGRRMASLVAILAFVAGALSLLLNVIRFAKA